MSTKPMEFTLDGVVSTKKPNDCPDCKIRVETYLKSIAEWKSALEAERAKVAKLKAELWVAKDSQLRTYDGLAQKADKYDEVVAENESLKRELWSLKEQDGRPYDGGNVADK